VPDPRRAPTNRIPLDSDPASLPVTPSATALAEGGDPPPSSDSWLTAKTDSGLVLHNARLTAELEHRLEQLQASRRRLVAAQDAEPRRL